jgi:hypothetical protein
MEYVFQRGGGEASQPVKLGVALDAGKSQLEIGEGPWTGLLDGDPLFQDVRRAKALTRMQGVAARMAVGETLRIRGAEKKEVAFWLRCVDDPIDIVNTNGNDHADEFWTWVLTEFGAYKPRFAGAYVCKNISGTSNTSQHSFGNAVDIFFDTIEHQREVYEAIKRGRCPVPIQNAISERVIWSPEPTGQRAYGGDPHWHLHCDFRPAYSGRCGVRG